MRWVNQGQSWRAGDRTITALMPPLFDSPVTRGVYDDKTGVYWAVDTFALPLPGPLDEMTDVPKADWEQGMAMFNCMNSPWYQMLDPEKFERHVDSVQELDIEILASCHSPIIKRGRVSEAFDFIRKLPSLPPPPQPQQADLEELMHCIATGKEYAWEPPPPPGA
jgi:hypothetical protein